MLLGWYKFWGIPEKLTPAKHSGHELVKLKGFSKIIVCIYGTFNNEFVINNDFTKYLKKKCFW